MNKIITFGEIMGRLSPNGFQRFRQALPGGLNMSFAGAEANVAVSIALLGGQATFVSALPDNAISDACIATLKGLGVNTRYVLKKDAGRLGLYYTETGANQRPSRVIYDRAGSALALTAAEDYPWEDIFSDANWLHISGITPALSKLTAEAALVAVRQAKRNGVAVSCDLNFRNKLWNWDPAKKPRQLAESVMREILNYVDLVLANEGDVSDVLGISAGNTDVEKGRLDIQKYQQVAREVVSQFSNVKKIAITLRESISANHNNWGAMLYDAKVDKPVYAPLNNGEYAPYQMKNIVDRVGGGDSFAAGLIFALNTPELSDQETAISFAVASSCLAHSLPGDFNFSSRAEVENLMRGQASGRVVR